MNGVMWLLVIQVKFLTFRQANHLVASFTTKRIENECQYNVLCKVPFRCHYVLVYKVNKEEALVGIVIFGLSCHLHLILCQ